MFLSEYPTELVRVGMRVLNFNAQAGIVKKIQRSDEQNVWIEIVWVDGTTTEDWTVNCDEIIVSPREFN